MIFDKGLFVTYRPSFIWVHTVSMGRYVLVLRNRRQGTGTQIHRCCVWTIVAATALRIIRCERLVQWRH